MLRFISLILVADDEGSGSFVPAQDTAIYFL